jgi:DNA (cytosine-5)-methyltransferase 1
MPTLNAFDNGDVRTTILIFYGNRVDDVRIQGQVINTLQARMGTGGNNMPMVANIASPLEARFYKGANAESAAGGHLQTNGSQVRRLTPLECERLQGFPDDWTAGQSDSQRYKQMGNAVAVPVVEWIIQNICDTV